MLSFSAAETPLCSDGNPLKVALRELTRCAWRRRAVQRVRQETVVLPCCQPQLPKRPSEQLRLPVEVTLLWILTASRELTRRAGCLGARVDAVPRSVC